jgi:hypothetical protein
MHGIAASWPSSRRCRCADGEGVRFPSRLGPVQYCFTGTRVRAVRMWEVNDRSAHENECVCSPASKTTSPCAASTMLRSFSTCRLRSHDCAKAARCSPFNTSVSPTSQPHPAARARRNKMWTLRIYPVQNRTERNDSPDSGCVPRVRLTARVSECPREATVTW